MTFFSALCRRSLCALPVVLCAPLLAQNDFTLRKTSPGALGQSLDFRFQGAPMGKNIVFALSISPGPTPLRLLHPSDSRVLSVGIESASVWFARPSTGSGNFSLPTPNDVSMHGAQFYFQSFTIPGARYVVDKISNAVVAQVATTRDSAPIPAKFVEARAFGIPIINVQLTTSGGDVLIAGGGAGSLLGAKGLKTTEYYSLHTMSVRKGPDLSFNRALGAAVPLRDGRVLVSGGADNNGTGVATCEIYDPKTNKFTNTGAMSLGRIGHTLSVLPDNTVLAAGGTSTLASPVLALANAQASAEIWDPKTGKWTATGSMIARRLAPAAVDLFSGMVLVSGGFEVRTIFGLPIPVGSVQSCEIYNFATRTWSPAGSMNVPRAVHTYNMIRLKDGRVLATGGINAGPLIVNGVPLKSAEAYDPKTDKWTKLPDLPIALALQSVTQMPDGRVIVAGGATGTPLNPIAIDDVSEFNPATNVWRSLPRLKTKRGAHTAALTPDGVLVLFGGQGGSGNVSLKTLETIR